MMIFEVLQAHIVTADASPSPSVCSSFLVVLLTIRPGNTVLSLGGGLQSDVSRSAGAWAHVS